MFLTRHNFHFLLATFIFFFWHCGASSSSNLPFFWGVCTPRIIWRLRKYLSSPAKQAGGNARLALPASRVVFRNIRDITLKLELQLCTACFSSSRVVFLEIRVTQLLKLELQLCMYANQSTIQSSCRPLIQTHPVIQSSNTLLSESIKIIRKLMPKHPRTTKKFVHSSKRKIVAERWMRKPLRN